MIEDNVYIGETSIQIGQDGFFDQPKEIINYIKYLQNKLQQKENIINELEKWIEEKFKIEDTQYYYVIDANDLKRKLQELKGSGKE